MSCASGFGMVQPWLLWPLAMGVGVVKQAGEKIFLLFNINNLAKDINLGSTYQASAHPEGLPSSMSGPGEGDTCPSSPASFPPLQVAREKHLP